MNETVSERVTIQLGAFHIIIIFGFSIILYHFGNDFIQFLLFILNCHYRVAAYVSFVVMDLLWWGFPHRTVTREHPVVTRRNNICGFVKFIYTSHIYLYNFSRCCHVGYRIDWKLHKLTYFKQHKRGITFFFFFCAQNIIKWNKKHCENVKNTHFYNNHCLLYCYTVFGFWFILFEHILLHSIPISCQSYLTFFFSHFIVLAFKKLYRWILMFYINTTNSFIVFINS